MQHTLRSQTEALELHVLFAAVDAAAIDSLLLVASGSHTLTSLRLQEGAVVLG